MKPESTLARLLKGWGGAVETAAPAAIAELQAQFDTFKAEAAAEVSDLAAKLEEALTAVRSLETERDEIAARLQAAADAAAQAAAEATAAKLAARKEKIVAAVGTARADAVFAAVEGMEDAQFEAVLSVMTAAGSTEAQSPMFNEQGASLDADPAAVGSGESKEMQILRARYGATSPRQ